MPGPPPGLARLARQSRQHVRPEGQGNLPAPGRPPGLIFDAASLGIQWQAPRRGSGWSASPMRRPIGTKRDPNNPDGFEFSARTIPLSAETIGESPRGSTKAPGRASSTSTTPGRPAPARRLHDLRADREGQQRTATAERLGIARRHADVWPRCVLRAVLASGMSSSPAPTTPSGTASSTAWTDWQSLGGIATSDPAASGAPAASILFVRGTPSTPSGTAGTTTAGATGNHSAASRPPAQPRHHGPTVASTSSCAAPTTPSGTAGTTTAGATGNHWAASSPRVPQPSPGVPAASTCLCAAPTTARSTTAITKTTGATGNHSAASSAPGQPPRHGAQADDASGRGTDNTVYQATFDGGWSSWSGLGGVVTSDPDAVSWGPGRFDVIARSPARRSTSTTTPAASRSPAFLATGCPGPHRGPGIRRRAALIRPKQTAGTEDYWEAQPVLSMLPNTRRRSNGSR